MATSEHIQLSPSASYRFVNNQIYPTVVNDFVDSVIVYSPDIEDCKTVKTPVLRKQRAISVKAITKGYQTHGWKLKSTLVTQITLTKKWGSLCWQ